MTEVSDFEITGRDLRVGMGIGGWDMEWTVMHKPSGTRLTYQAHGHRPPQRQTRSEALALLTMFVDTHYPREEVMPNEPNGSAEGPRDIGPGDQAVAGAAHPPAVPFGAQSGTKIVFHGIGGYEAENEKARSVLQVGSTYTLLELNVGGWRSSLSIKEAPGMWFNTVMFQPEPVAGAAPVSVGPTLPRCECGMTGPCAWAKCRSPNLAQKGGE
jgi:hypothetical protein